MAERDRGITPDGHRIREARKAKGWTQAVLAEKAGLDERTVRKAEQGRRVDFSSYNAIVDKLENHVEVQKQVIVLLVLKGTSATSALSNLMNELRNTINAHHDISIEKFIYQSLLLYLQMNIDDAARLFFLYDEDNETVWGAPSFSSCYIRLYSDQAGPQFEHISQYKRILTKYIPKPKEPSRHPGPAPVRP